MNKLLQLSLLLFFIAQLNAQSFGGGFMVGSPRGAYKDSNPHTGYGLQLEGMLISPTQRSPFGIGLDAGFLIYSNKNEYRPFSHTIPDVGVDVSRSNSMINMHLVFQIAPFQEGPVRPYAEFYGGGSYLFTLTSIDSDYDNRSIASDVNFDDFAWSYGIGGGIKIALNNPDYDSPELFLNLKFRYLSGSEAEYLTKNDVKVNHRTGVVTYYPRRSETDQMTFTIGVIARF